MKSACCVMVAMIAAMVWSGAASAGTADRKAIKFRGATGPAAPALAPTPGSGKAPAPTAAVSPPQPPAPAPVVKPAVPKAAKATAISTNAPVINGTAMTKPPPAVGGASPAPTNILSGSSVSLKRR